MELEPCRLPQVPHRTLGTLPQACNSSKVEAESHKSQRALMQFEAESHRSRRALMQLEAENRRSLVAMAQYTSRQQEPHRSQRALVRHRSLLVLVHHTSRPALAKRRSQRERVQRRSQPERRQRKLQQAPGSRRPSLVVQALLKSPQLWLAQAQRTPWSAHGI